MRKAALQLVDPWSTTGPQPIRPGMRVQPLVVFRRLAAVLDLTAEMATDARRCELHAELSARLAIMRARVAAGDTGAPLVAAMAEFSGAFKSFIAVELGFGRS